MAFVGVSFEIDFAYDNTSKSRKEALTGVAARIGSARAELSHGDLVKSLLNRERLGSTALGGGIAAPHIVCDTIRQPLIQVTRLSAAVDFDAADRSSVDLLLSVFGNRRDMRWLLMALRRFAIVARCSEIADQLRISQGVADAEDVLAQVGLYTDRTCMAVRA